MYKTIYKKLSIGNDKKKKHLRNYWIYIQIYIHDQQAVMWLH